MNPRIQFEQQAKDENDQLKVTWDQSPYNFLLMRTQEKYNLKVISQRRLIIESKICSSLPILTDEMLKSLYELACIKYMNNCHRRYDGFTGFGKTPSEFKFQQSLEQLIKGNPKLKHIEIYPSQSNSTDLRPNFKMVVGNYVPDFLIFGLKTNGSSAIAVEIDGDSHVYKYSKDELRYNHLKQMKIFTFEIPNSQATDTAYIYKSLLDMYKPRTGSFNEQILRAKRSIWTKTIACQLSFDEIENYISTKFSTNLNLKKEALILKTLPECPRRIRAELSDYFDLRS